MLSADVPQGLAIKRTDLTVFYSRLRTLIRRNIVEMFDRGEITVSSIYLAGLDKWSESYNLLQRRFAPVTEGIMLQDIQGIHYKVTTSTYEEFKQWLHPQLINSLLRETLIDQILNRQLCHFMTYVIRVEQPMGDELMNALSQNDLIMSRTDGALGFVTFRSFLITLVEIYAIDKFVPVLTT